MAEIISRGKRNVLVTDAAVIQIINRAAFGDKVIVSLLRTDEGDAQAGVVFTAMEPEGEVVPQPGTPYRKRRRGPRIAGLIGGIAIVLIVAFVVFVMTTHPVAPASTAANSSSAGSADRFKIAVAVTDLSGNPIADAQVFITGAQDDGHTNAAGQVNLNGMTRGIYQVDAEKSGYYGATGRVTVTSNSPVPVQIGMSFMPPSGTFVLAGSNVYGHFYEVLQIANFPFQAQYALYVFQDCNTGWVAESQTSIVDNQRNNTLMGPSGGTYAGIVGPGELNSGWVAGSPPTAPPAGATCG